MARTKAWSDAQRCEVPAYFLFPPVALETLGWAQRWRFTRREARGNLGRGWRRRAATANGLSAKVLWYLSWLVLENINSHSLGGRRSRRARPSVVDKGAGAIVVLGAPSTCAQCALQNGPGSQIRGAPLPGPGGEQGLVLDQRMPSVGVELGDRRTTGAKARFKLNLEGKHEICLVPGRSSGKRVVLFNPITPIHAGPCLGRREDIEPRTAPNKS
jgi:hypothetical protein